MGTVRVWNALVLSLVAVLPPAPADAYALWSGDSDELGSHGYFRAGHGWSEGEDQVCFKAPGAGAKYRLGNECEIYAKASLYYRHRFSGSGTAPYLHLEFMPVFNRGYGSSQERITHDQLFLELGNLADSPLKFWIGRRYNRRRDVHINDFFYMNLQGDGLGLSDIPLGIADLSLTYMQRYRFPEGSGLGTDDEVPLRSYDVSLYNLETNPGGSLMLDLRYATIGGGDFPSAAGVVSVQRAGGWAFAAQHRQQGVLGGTNTLVLQYGNGAARSAWTLPTEPDSTVGRLTRPGMADALESAETWRLLDFLLYETDAWAVMGVAILEQADHRAFDGSDRTWFSAGARPMLFLGDHWRLVAELGFDRVHDETYAGSLKKLTLAAEWAPERRFFSRPALRAYVTHAAWSDDLRGRVGTPEYGDRTSGWGLGLQAEAWW